MKSFMTAISDIKGIDIKNRRIPIMASTTEIDRDHEVVLPQAFRKTLARYLSDNPVILASHNYSGDSVGKAVDFTIVDHGIPGYVEFAPTVAGEKYWQLYKGGYQRAFSIGWMGSKWFDVDHEKCRKDGQVVVPFDDIPAITLPYDKNVNRYLVEGEILETSVCAVPCNRSAISQLKGADITAFKQLLLEEMEGIKAMIGEIKTAEEEENPLAGGDPPDGSPGDTGSEGDPGSEGKPAGTPPEKTAEELAEEKRLADEKVIADQKAADELAAAELAKVPGMKEIKDALIGFSSALKEILEAVVTIREEQISMAGRLPKIPGEKEASGPKVSDATLAALGKISKDLKTIAQN